MSVVGSLARRWRGLERRSRALLAMIAVLVVVIAPAVHRLHRYMQYDPGFCTASCHASMPTHELRNGIHKGVNCAKCHQLRFGESARQYLLTATRGPTAVTPHGSVTSAQCAACHTSGDGSKMQVAATVGHRSHLEGKEKIDCVKCHASKDHVLSPHDTCKTCHEKVEIREQAMEGIPCLSCHNFLSKTGGRLPLVSHDCTRCHDTEAAIQRSPRFSEIKKAPEVSKAMIHGNLFACSLCHNPHKKTDELRSATEQCIRCHGLTARTSITELASEHSAPHRGCTSCHRPHGVRAEVGNSCSRCHETPAVPGAFPSTADRHPRCSTCHKPHEFEASAKDCAGCHDNEATKIASWNAKTHSNCVSCHPPHSRYVDSKSNPSEVPCRQCHALYTGHGHREGCVACHDPHLAKKQTKTCVSCHAPVFATMSAGGGAHETSCDGCHPTHSFAGASARCAKCHETQGQKVATARVPQHMQCASCHTSHDFSASASVNACSKCHADANAEVHKGACADCHASHGSPFVANTSCLKCHATMSKEHLGKHNKCSSCHKGHEPAKRAVGKCTLCHEAQIASVLAWRPSEHQKCTSCHAEYGRSSLVSCAPCHNKESTSATGGKHGCTNCHDTHQKPGIAAAACARCHAPEVAGAKQRGVTHSKCNNCHKPHKFARTTCQTCHNAVDTLAAHADKSHGKCSNCHPSHAKSTYPPADCLTCHKDMAQHNPNAKTCIGCHLFK